MAIELWEIRRSINEANSTLDKANKVADDAARLLPGRLRHVNVNTLTKLKKELRDFNMHTGEWKNHGEK